MNPSRAANRSAGGLGILSQGEGDRSRAESTVGHLRLVAVSYGATAGLGSLATYGRGVSECQSRLLVSVPYDGCGCMERLRFQHSV